MTEEQKPKRGRPPLPMPEPIPDTPENIARAIMRRPPKRDWDYLKRFGREAAADEGDG